MQTVRIGVTPYSPWVNPCVLRTPNFKRMGPICKKFPGISTLVSQLLFSIIASNYSEVFVPIYDKRNVTSWEALVESLNNNETDIGLDFWELTLNRTNIVSASYPVIHPREVFIVSAAAFRSAQTGITLIPFDKYSIVLIGTFFCAILLLETVRIVMNYPHNTRNITWTVLIDNFYTSVVRISGQYDIGPLKRSMGISAGLVAWTWSFAILVFAYNSLITSNLVSYESVPFRSLYELADIVQQGELRLIINPGESIVQNEDPKLHQLIRNAIFIDDANKALKLIEQNKRLVYYDSSLTAPFTISKHCDKFRIVDTHLIPRPLSIIAALNSTWADQLRSTVVAYQTAFENRAVAALRGVNCQTPKDGVENAYTITMRLTHLRTAFVIALSGYTSSTAVLLIERYKDALNPCVRAAKTA